MQNLRSECLGKRRRIAPPRSSVREGEAVEAGQALATIEAMKMENVLRADRNATVVRVLAAPGDVLAVDDVILEFA